MGTSIYAHLFYGISLGEEVEYDLSNCTDEEKDELEDGEYLYPMEWEAYYFLKTNQDDLDYKERKIIVDELGVDIITSISYDYPRYSLAVKESLIECSWGVEKVDVYNVVHADYGKWNILLENFIKKLGIIVDYDMARWYMGVLYSY